MNTEKNKSKRVESALREAFCRQATPPVTEDWTLDVMRNVRRVAAQASKTKPQPIVYIAWRAVWATTAAALIFMAVDFMLLPSMNEVGWQAHEVNAVLE